MNEKQTNTGWSGKFATIAVFVVALVFLYMVGSQNNTAPALPQKVETEPASAASALQNGQSESSSQADQEQEEEPWAFETLDEAIEAIRPRMTDTMDSISPGTALLTMWSRDNMKWSELVKLPKTKRALVMKDSGEQRGKGMCVSGRIIEIQADDTASKKIFHGGLWGDEGIYRFTAVGSTGNIVERSFARFCGVVIGRFDYSNSMNGVAHSIQLVGMFDLPANKKGESSQERL